MKNTIILISITLILLGCSTGLLDPFLLRGQIHIDPAINTEKNLIIGLVEPENFTNPYKTSDWSSWYSENPLKISGNHSTFEFNRVNPGEYMIFAFIDENNNNKWDGNLAENKYEAFSMWAGSFLEQPHVHNHPFKYIDYPMSNIHLVLNKNYIPYRIYPDAIGDSLNKGQGTIDITEIYFAHYIDKIYGIIHFNDAIPFDKNGKSRLTGAFEFNTQSSTTTPNDHNLYNTELAVDAYILLTSYDPKEKKAGLSNYISGNSFQIYLEMKGNTIHFIFDANYIGSPNSIRFGCVAGLESAGLVDGMGVVEYQKTDP